MVAYSLLQVDFDEMLYHEQLVSQDAVLPDIGFDFEDVSHDDFVAENQA